MFAQLEEAIRSLAAGVASVEEHRLTGESAMKLVKLCTEAERILAATRTIAARRVEQSKAWQKNGHRSAADWMAAATGTMIGRAVGMLETARRLDEVPMTKTAFRAGELSEEQVRVISDAAYVSPRHERTLIACAQAETVKTLTHECQRVKNAAVSDEQARLASIHRRRYFRHWTEHDGAVRLDARLTPQNGAEVIAAVEQAKNKIFTSARREGRRESTSAYAADALVQLVTGDAGDAVSGPRAMVNVVVDHEVLTSGIQTERTKPARFPAWGRSQSGPRGALFDDSILRVLVKKGGDIQAVSKPKRSVPSRLRAALEVRDPACVVPGCGQTLRLEIDHIIPLRRPGTHQPRQPRPPLPCTPFPEDPSRIPAHGGAG